MLPGCVVPLYDWHHGLVSEKYTAFICGKNSAAGDLDYIVTRCKCNVIHLLGTK